MKKRIALAAAIAMAIAVGGMLPASAKLGAPVVATTTCERAGGTLEIKTADGDVGVARNASALVITGMSTLCDGKTALAGLTSVVIKAVDADSADADSYGDVTIDLEYPDGYVANFASIPMAIQAENTLWFKGEGLIEPGAEFRPITGTVTEDTFTLGTVTGTYFASLLKFTGGDADDVFDASAVTTTPVDANGGEGNDTLSGGAEDDKLKGGAGTAIDGDDVLYGNAGDDDLSVGDSGTTCANPHPVFPAPKCAGASLTSTGSDQAWGGTGNDSITGDGADTVAPGDGADTVGGNINQLRYSDSSAAISVNLTSAAHRVLSTAGNDVFQGTVREFVGSEFDDTFVGTEAGAETFYGLGGKDTLYGLGNNDFLSGNAGNDVVKAGGGNDSVFGEAGNDQVGSGAGDDTVYGGTGDDVMYGGPGSDLLRGQQGKDQAWGGRSGGDLCAAEVTDSCEYKK